MATAMGHEQFLALLREHGAVQMREYVRGGALVTAAVKHGWDLTRWRCDSANGAALFYRVESLDDPIIESPRILAINAPEEERAKWEANIAGQDDVILIMGEFRP